jgi:hypothetical protein
MKNFIKKSLVLPAALSLSAVPALTSCGESEFHALSEEKQIEYVENYMRETYNEEWKATGILGRTEKLGKKIPAGMFISTLENSNSGDVVCMWITSSGQIFEDRFMLRMRQPAKDYLVNAVETALPDAKAFAFVTIDYPELNGDYRKDGNVEPLLTETNLNIEVEIYTGKDKPFKSEDIQKLTSALKDVQFDSIGIWICDDTDITSTEKNNSQLKLSGQKKWQISKDEKGRCTCKSVENGDSVEADEEESEEPTE